MGDSVLIRLQNVTKRFKDKTVLEGINLDIRAGEIFGLIGGNGTGKTTFLNILVGFIRFDGDILFQLPETGFGSIIGKTKEISTSFGFASQEPSFYPKLTVRENLSYFANLFGMPEELIDENMGIVLNLVRLETEKNTLAGYLSYGMQKRLDIGCALMHNPKILILDEPTANLDPNLSKQIWLLIREINRNGTTVIVTSHFLQELSSVCHRIALIHDKHITMMNG